MIDKLSYDEVLTISKNLKQQANIIERLMQGREIPELDDFVATIEGYSKFLENTVDINKDADMALQELKSKLK